MLSAACTDKPCMCCRATARACRFTIHKSKFPIGHFFNAVTSFFM